MTNLDSTVFLFTHASRTHVIGFHGSTHFPTIDAALWFIECYDYTHVSPNSFAAALIRDNYRKKGYRLEDD